MLPGTASLGWWGLCSQLEARVQGPWLGPSCSHAEHLRAWFAWWAVGEVGAGTEEEIRAGFFQIGVLEGPSFGQKNDGWAVGWAQGLRLCTGS